MVSVGTMLYSQGLTKGQILLSPLCFGWQDSTVGALNPQ